MTSEQLELLEKQLQHSQKATDEICKRFTETLAELAKDEKIYNDFCSGIPELPLIMGCIVGLSTQIKGLQEVFLFYQQQTNKAMQTVVTTVNDAIAGRI